MTEARHDTFLAAGDGAQDAAAAILAQVGSVPRRVLSAMLRDALDGLDTRQSARIGRALSRIPADDGATARVTLIASSSLLHLGDHLRCALAARGLALELTTAGFDQWRFFLAAPSFEGEAAGQTALLVLDDTIVFDGLPDWSDLDRIGGTLDALLGEIRDLAAAYTAATDAALVVVTPVLSRRFRDLLVTHRSRARLGALWARFTAGILELAADFPALAVCDGGALLQDRAAGGPVTDPRMQHIAREAWSGAAQHALACGIAPVIAARFGEGRKCLLVDFDNTLWHGAVGDLGPHGIEIEGGTFGTCHETIQRSVKALARQGVILCGVTKNDPASIDELFAHRDMPLGRDDFVTIKANWDRKSGNIREIAETLNIGLDSMVFLDDSGLEIAEVRAALPDVLCRHLSDPFDFQRHLTLPALFEKASVTGEDRARNDRYRAEARRAEARAAAGGPDAEAFLRRIGLAARLEPVDQRSLARVAQLSQRTNQFNMTQVRWDAPALGAEVDRGLRAFALTVRDDFGDYGLVGAVFARRTHGRAEIENAILSCRVFSRGAEHHMLIHVIARLFEDGAEEVRATFRPSPKNGQFKDFYADIGGVLLAEDGATGARTYAITRDRLAHAPDWIAPLADSGVAA